MIKKILTIFLVLSSLFFVGCKKTSDTTDSTQTESVPQDSNLSLEKMQANLAKAKNAAKPWKENAQFTALVLKMSPDSKYNVLTETFVFGSADDTTNWWTYSISESTEKIVRALTPKEDYLGTDFQPIKEEYLKTSYIDALKTAELGGGTDFVSKNPNNQISAVLAQSAPKNWLWWQIEYQSTNANLKILVSASDSKIYNENGDISS